MQWFYVCLCVISTVTYISFNIGAVFVQVSAWGHKIQSSGRQLPKFHKRHWRYQWEQSWGISPTNIMCFWSNDARLLGVSDFVISAPWIPTCYQIWTSIMKFVERLLMFSIRKMVNIDEMQFGKWEFGVWVVAYTRALSLAHCSLALSWKHSHRDFITVRCAVGAPLCRWPGVHGGFAWGVHF